MHLKEKILQTSTIPVPCSSFINYLHDKWASTNCPNVSVMIPCLGRSALRLVTFGGSLFLSLQTGLTAFHNCRRHLRTDYSPGYQLESQTHLKMTLLCGCQPNTCKYSIFIFISAPHLQPETQAVDMGGTFILDSRAEKRHPRRYRVSTNGQV